MANVVILDPGEHRELRVRSEASPALGDAQRFVQVVIRELPLLVVHYPVFLTKDSETGAFFLGAMLGIDPEENLFLGPNGWHDSYRPLNLQRAPFFVAADRLAIDLDSPRTSRTEGQRLFDDAGSATDYTQRIMAAFHELRPGLEATRAFIEALLALNLVEPIDIDLSFDDGERRELRDLYTINQDALRGLPDEAVLDLFRRGYLHLISLMIASTKQVPVLARMRNRRLLEPAGGAGGYAP